MARKFYEREKKYVDLPKTHQTDQPTLKVTDIKKILKAHG